MSLLTPPPTTARTSTAEPQRPCALRFLDDHLKHGGLDTNGYDMLHGVLQMFGEISLLLFPPSHRLEAKVMRRIHLLSDRIAGTFHIFGKHIDIQLRRAKRAMRELPDLAVAHEDRHRQNLEVWRRKLRTLHEPSSNDVNLYRHILTRFDSEVHSYFLQLHRDAPEHNIWQLRHLLNHIRDCIVSLQENIEEANEIVSNLDTEFTIGTWGADGVQRVERFNEPERLSLVKEPNRKTRAVEARSKTINDKLKILDDFFGEPESGKTEDSQASPQKQYGIVPGSGEGGLKTPRVFTRSFDELEDSVRSLGLHRINVSIDGASDANGAIKVKDFALHTPCLLPSPATLLERREALCTRQPTWEHRLIGGQLVQSRRPHDRYRAQTIDERGDSLDAWLAKSLSPDRSLDRTGSIRSRVLHRQHSL